MSKKLEETLNLRSMDDIDIVSEKLGELTEEDIDNISDEYEEIKEHSDEMNKIHDAAIKAHKEILDLGYSVDTKYAGNILSTSATFLDIAIKASKSKVENKLKRIKMDMDVELKTVKVTPSNDLIVDGEEIPQEEGQLLSRNEVIQKMEEILKSGSGILTSDNKNDENSDKE